jgi:CheY-like chemotaxis protein
MIQTGVQGGGDILIVEDDDLIRDTIAFFFRMSGYDIQTATNGLEALTKLDSGFAPNLILLDEKMPVMGGLEFLSKLAKKALPRQPRVAVLSGDHTISAAAMALGAEEFLLKPVDIDLLEELAQNSCGFPSKG